MTRGAAAGRLLWIAAMAWMQCAAQFTTSQPDDLPSDYPRSLERSREALMQAGAPASSDVPVLLQLADVYLNLGDDLYDEPEQRRAAYEESARLAARALALDERCADAHFLFAAALGSALRIKGGAAAGLAVAEVKRHVVRALELRPDHPQALQMMGGLLAELPWFLGGDSVRARDYLERAVAADGNFTNARLLLAKLYLREGKRDAARRQLQAVVAAQRPHYPYTWARRFRPEAERLLQSLP